MRLNNIFKYTLVLSALVGGLLLFSPQSASAAPGYFTGQNFGLSGRHLIHQDYGSPTLTNTNDVDNFLWVLNQCLFGGPCGSLNGPVAASYIVLTMMGDGNHSVGQAQAQWNNFDTRVRQYANQGRINFNVYDSYSVNTMMVPYNNPYDVVAYTSNASVWSIVFYNPDGSKYAIKKDCANPVGNNSPLQNVQPQWNLSSSAWADQASVFPGQNITFHFRIHNNGPDSATFQYVDRFQPYSNGGNPGGVWSWPTPNRFENNFPAGWDTNAYSVAGINVPVNYTGNRYCAWTEYAGWSSWDGSARASNQVCVTVNTPTPSCNGYTLTPSSGLDPTTQFTITPSVRFQNQPTTNWVYSNGGRLFVTVTGPGYNKDYTLDWGPPAADDLTVAQLFPATGNTGTYTITYGIRGAPNGNITCGGGIGTSFLVGLYPYFRVESGDIAAGAGFGVACTLDNTAKIRGWNKGAGSYFGAGAQLGALALNSLDSNFFPTSTNVDGSSSGVASANRTGLTFANNTAPVGSYVGLPCIPDYAATAAATEGAIIGSSPNLNSLPAGTKATYVINGDVTIPGGSLKNDVHVTFVVLSGDVTINNDITYDPYATIAHAPQFQLLVKGGSILIKHQVGELHGVYDAQPDGAGIGGTINTCYMGSGKAQYAPCSNKQLKFYGAVTAKTILMARTYGNLNPYGAVTNWPAETFIYTPELWAAYSNKTGNGTMKYDAITSLPPIL